MAAECLLEREACESNNENAEKDSCKENEARTSRGCQNKALGDRGERCAVAYLSRRQFQILDRNWRCKFGEADIVALDDGNLVFVEVKTRSSSNQGFPSEAVDKKKRDKYEKIALCYLERSNFSDMPVRFDVVSVVRVDENRALLRHHINAFGVE